jgi:hypothetical protein
MPSGSTRASRLFHGSAMAGIQPSATMFGSQLFSFADAASL